MSYRLPLDAHLAASSTLLLDPSGEIHYNGDDPTMAQPTLITAVLGWPVEHSRSPAIHGAAFDALGLHGVMLRCAVSPSTLAAAVAGLRALGFVGASVTVPHKLAVADLCDALDPSAQRVGAVNCIARDGDRLIGHNTDAAGFTDGLIEAGHPPAGRRAVVLGGGGAARAVAVGLADVGASVTVVARDPSRVAWTAARRWTATELAALAPTTDLWVDATSTGLDVAAEAALPAAIPLEASPASAFVCSLIYHRDTALVLRARHLGLATVDGGGMLVHQGARAFSLWTGRPAPIDAMWRGLRG